MAKIIDASNEFEELMDQTDFDTWLESDDKKELDKKYPEQDIAPFEVYEKNLSKLQDTLKKIRLLINEVDNKDPNSSYEKKLIDYFREVKEKRLEARIKYDNEKNYQELRSLAFFAINVLQNLDIELFPNKKYWFILFNNELSICYAGLKNSSISLGYAEEAIKLIENEESFQEFKTELKKRPSERKNSIKKLDFVESKLYSLYTLSLYNRAEAERRSYLYEAAEKDFKRIIKYVKEDADLFNSNFSSAITGLAELYIDRGRGKEALDLLEILMDPKSDYKLRDDDKRYWSAFFAQVSALIDQAEYPIAEKMLLECVMVKKNGSVLTLRPLHVIAASGFKGLNQFARCQIEKFRNTLKINKKKREELQNKVENALSPNNIRIMRDREQYDAASDAHKNLGKIYNLLSNYEKGTKNRDKCIRNFTLFLSKGQISSFEDFANDKKMGVWVDACDDLDVLESYSEIVCKAIKSSGKMNDSYKEVLLKLREKIRKECDDRDEPQRSERVVAIINEALGKEKCSFLEKQTIAKRKALFPDKSEDPKVFKRTEIRQRLDSNEKKFDKVLFKRSEMKNNHLAELIVLRRWNSFTPGLFRKEEGEILGGGYLLRVNRALLKNGNKKQPEVENIVIDPGYNFLQNFCSEGFHIQDIDTIIVTHSHLDHCANLLPIMDLILQINKRFNRLPEEKEQPKRRIKLCLSQGAYKKFVTYIIDREWQKQLKDVILIENQPDMTWMPFKGLKIRAIQTNHIDLGGMHALGLKVEISKKGRSENICIGFTGDTSWYEKIACDFSDCELLCVHLGSLKYQEIGFNDKIYQKKRALSTKRKTLERDKEELAELRKLYWKSNHLLFFGTHQLLATCKEHKKERLVVVGEFGEELKYGLRIDVCNKLSKDIKNHKKNLKCVPGDIGLYIVLEKNGTKKIRCNFCKEYVEKDNINTFFCGKEDAIHYICKSCDYTLTELQKQAFVDSER